MLSHFIIGLTYWHHVVLFIHIPLQWRVIPLADNGPHDRFTYLVTVFTGTTSRAGTKSNVFFKLSGEYENTEVRKLEGNTEKVSGVCYGNELLYDASQVKYLRACVRVCMRACPRACMGMRARVCAIV